MAIEIIKEKENILLNRKRYSLEHISEDNKTPSRLSLIAKIAKKVGAKEDMVVIKHIYPKFGNTSSKILVDVYHDRAMLEKFEHKNLVAKHAPKVDKKEE